jgi:hypothetical protein
VKKNNPKMETKFWRSSAQPALEFARIGYDNFHFEPHFHDHYVLMLLEKGVNMGRRCRENYAVLPGEMLLLQPGEMHTGHSFEGKRSSQSGTIPLHPESRPSPQKLSSL